MSALQATLSFSVSQAFLRKLIGFYTPKKFTANSTQFDMGYEQCKADLRNFIRVHVPNLSDYEDRAEVDDVPTLIEPPREERKSWRLFGPRT